MADFLDNLFRSNGCNVDGNNFETMEVHSSTFYNGNREDDSFQENQIYQENAQIQHFNEMESLWGNNTAFMEQNFDNNVHYQPNFIPNNPYHGLLQPLYPIHNYNTMAYLEPQEHVYEEDEEIYQNDSQLYNRDEMDQSIILGNGLNNSEVKEILHSFNEQQAHEKMTNSLEYQKSWERTLNNLVETYDVYNFIENNPYLQSQSQQNFDYFSIGMEHYTEGRVNQAILAFEAEVQNNIENSECWNMLGVCHSENDDDKRAIQCLKKSLEYDQYNISSLLLLGISYCNEMDSLNALESLKAWVNHNPMFYGLDIKADEYSDGTLIDEVMQLMLEVNRLSPSDCDVKIVLGVLYNVTQDYSNAVECFKFALQQRPNDYSLQNKLGATLANSNRSSEAISHYIKALELRPTYARGWLNLGIAYSNLNRNEDAAKAHTQTIHLNRNAKHVWGYLRTVLVYMNQYKLVELTNTENLELIAKELNVQLINN